MKDLTTAAGVIELVCDGDRPIGRSVITVGEMIELANLAEKEKAARDERTA
jgi:hypothetical protein